VYDRNSVRQIEPAMEPEAIEETEPEDIVETQPMSPAIAEGEVDLADMPEPEYVPEPADVVPVAAVVVPAAEPAPQPPQPKPVTSVSGAVGLGSLVVDMTLGRARIMLIASISEARDSAIVADVLVNEALKNGLSVCRVDAGSNRVSSAPGLTDLCADKVSFGDVVHRIREGLAEVPWGEVATLDRRSMKPLTLIEALADIYEVVVVSTGRIGLNSTLPLFDGARARVVMVRQPSTPEALVEAVTADAASLGFGAVSSVVAPEAQAAVA
jgi:hypothetical protein